MVIQCRTCLSENANRDICSLPTDIGVEKTPEDVILFSLGIELSNQSKITTKLCSECYKNIQKYYKFKLLAQESNSYLQSLNLKNEEGNDSELQSLHLGFNEIDLNLQAADLKDDDWIDVPIPNNNIPIKQVKAEIEKYYYENVLDDNRDKDIAIKLRPIKKEKNEPFVSIPVIKPPLKEKSKKKIKKKGYAPRKENTLRKSFHCEPCRKTFSSKYTMQIHQGKFHSDSDAKKFQCDACHQSLFRKIDLQRHIDKLHMDWRCRLCNMKSNSRSSYLKHAKSHNGISPEIKESNFKVCPLCGKLISNLAVHLASHRGVLYFCKGCDKKYRSRAARDRHFKSIHQGVVYHCGICNKNVKNLLQHNKYYHKPDGRNHECHICGHRVINLASLTTHLTTHAAPHLPCPECPKLFKNEARLKLHRRQIHEREFRHMCSECQKGFFYKSDLTIHMATHTSLRPFQCDHCYEPFKLRSCLIKHFKTKHKIGYVEKNK